MAAGLGFADQDGIDLGLLGGGREWRLADRNANGVAPGKFEDARADQPVMNDDIGFLKFALRLERQELRIARSGTHERNAANRWGGVIDKRSLKLAGVGLGVAGKEGVA